MNIITQSKETCVYLYSEKKEYVLSNHSEENIAGNIKHLVNYGFK